MQSNSFVYSLKVWLTSVALAPIIYLCIEACIKKNYYASFTAFLNEQIGIYVMCILFGGLFSLLTWLLFFVIIKFVIIYLNRAWGIKYLLSLIGALLTIGTFAIFFPVLDVHTEFFYLMVANCICISGGSLYYHLEIQRPPEIILNQIK